MNRTLVLLTVLLVSATLVHAENWPQFRGPTVQGLSTEKNPPLKWSARENIAWKTELPGESWSSPVVWGDRVFVTTATEGGESCHVLELVPAGDVVILAVPDVAIGAVAREVVPLMKPGSLLMTLDPAAPLDDQLPRRADIGCVIAHPCHPSVFNWEPTENAFRDFYGGISAKQGIVVALMWGAESYYALGLEVSTAMYAPVSRAHRVTLAGATGLRTR
jgi:hypothetical protein